MICRVNTTGRELVERVLLASSSILRGKGYIRLLKTNIKDFFFLNTYAVVQFYRWFKFYFLLFLGMVMYDNEFETKENKI